MKKLIYLITLLALLLVACEKDEKSFNFTVDEYETALKNIINENKGNSFIEMKGKEIKDGKYQIELTSGILVIITPDKDSKVKNVSVGATSNALMVQNKEVQIAFKALLKSVDDTLSATQQLAIFDKLKITGNSDMLDRTEVYSLNNIMYTFKGSIERDAIILQAKPN
ncbi:hypothetical protein [Lysinibacillus sp. NPDC096212]|uniref:hypothetical protein n=1 Tax=Lysinibacillus sp. NPDC096212 TaxID=3364135 RepID=UPI0038018630